MKIISTYKDYYDGLSNYSDNYHKWLRRFNTLYINKIDINYKKLLTFYDNKKYWQQYTGCDIIRMHNTTRIPNLPWVEYEKAVIDLRLIVFCGNVYPCAVYSIPCVNNIIQSTCNYNKLFTDLNCSGFYIKNNERYFDYIKQVFSGDIPEYFKTLNVVHDVPILCVSKSHIDIFNWNTITEFTNNDIGLSIVINPILNNTGFQKIFNIYDCFQNLENYIWNVLVNDNITSSNISDVLKAESHGFDKFSFRKDKTSKY